jgi:aminotransferase
VFTRAELKVLAGLCQEFDCLLITDEIYEHIIFDGATHVPAVSLPDMRERCVVVNSLSKTFSVTGWRVGWVIAPPELTNSIRKVHDFMTVGAATPLQQAGITALQLPDEYFSELATTYQTKRDNIVAILRQAGLRPFVPAGAYYVMCELGDLPFADDFAFAKYLVEEVGVAAVPGSSFFSSESGTSRLVRFCFAKRPETLAVAAERLQSLKSQV